jgi:hypothetical protein
MSGDIPAPDTPHAGLMLGGMWPASSASEWEAASRELRVIGARLNSEVEGAQPAILRLVTNDDQSGPTIDALTRLVQRRTATAIARVKAYGLGGMAADAVSAATYTAKLSMDESVRWGEKTIEAAQAELKPQIAAAQAAGQGAVAAAKTAELDERTIAAISKAQDEVWTAAIAGAGKVEAAEAALASAAPLLLAAAAQAGTAVPMSGGTASAPAAPAPAIPASGGGGAQNVDYNVGEDGTDADHGVAPANSNQNVNPGDGSQQPPKVEPAASTTPNGTAPASPPVASAPSPGGPSMGGMGGGPSSVLGSMMQPMHGIASPASSPPMSSAGAAGSPGGMPGVGAGSAGAPSPGGVGGAGAGGGPGVSPAGAGRFAAGVAGAAGSAASIGQAVPAAAASAAGNVASGASAAAANAANAAAAPAASTPPAGGGVPPVMSGPAVMAHAAPMVPPSPVAGSSSSPVVSGGPGPTPVTGSVPVGGQTLPAGGVSATGGFAPGVVPLLTHGGPVPDHISGAELSDAAASAARVVVLAMVAQSRGYGIGMHWGTSVLQSREGVVSAWLASNEGPGYVPVGARIPDGVRVVFADPQFGQDLTDRYGAGSAPADVLAEHARMYVGSSSGARVLAMAATAGPGQDVDYVDRDGVRIVTIDARAVEPGHGYAGQHRCQVRPADWDLVSQIPGDELGREAIGLAQEAVPASGVTYGSSVEVLERLASGEPVTKTQWYEVAVDMSGRVSEYQLARDGQNPSPEQLWHMYRMARGTEAVWLLQHVGPGNRDAFADVLYAAREAGLSTRRQPTH